MKGVIKEKVDDKGFGFITPEGTDPNDKGVFFHVSGTASKEAFDALAKGQAVTFDMGEDTGKGPVAINVKAA